MTFDGLDWERTFKTVEVGSDQRKREKQVRDLKCELDRVKNQNIPNQNFHIFNQTQEEHEELMRQRRANAFTLHNCLPDIGSILEHTKKIDPNDEIFSLSFIDAIKRGLIQWPRDYPEEFRKLANWSEKNPITLGENRTRAFFLCGSHRIGKSLFSKLMAIKLFDEETAENKRRTGLVKFVTLQNLNNSYVRASAEDKHRMEMEIMGVKYLFLDDTGNQHGTNWNETNILDWIGRRLNTKYRDGKKIWTFFTSNSQIADLGFDPAVVERIRESSFEIKLGKTFEGRNQKTALQTQILNGNPTYS